MTGDAAAHGGGDIEQDLMRGDELGFKLAHHQLAAPRRGLPGDELEGIAGDVLAQLAELTG